MPYDSKLVWKEVSGELFTHLRELRKQVKGYSYEQKHLCVATDDRLCHSFLQSLEKAKKSLFSISDLCFSLHTGNKLLPLLDTMRDEADILSDEITIRSIRWVDIPPDFMRKLVRADRKLLQGMDDLVAGLDRIFLGILKEVKRKKPSSDFWSQARKDLGQSREQLRQQAILFKEREALCNITSLTLKRSFEGIREDIRWTV